jgi:hypothetical protein
MVAGTSPYSPAPETRRALGILLEVHRAGTYAVALSVLKRGPRTCRHGESPAPTPMPPDPGSAGLASSPSGNTTILLIRPNVLSDTFSNEFRNTRRAPVRGRERLLGTATGIFCAAGVHSVGVDREDHENGVRRKLSATDVVSGVLDDVFEPVRGALDIDADTAIADIVNFRAEGGPHPGTSRRAAGRARPGPHHGTALRRRGTPGSPVVAPAAHTRRCANLAA